MFIGCSFPEVRTIFQFSTHFLRTYLDTIFFAKQDVITCTRMALCGHLFSKYVNAENERHSLLA